MSAKGHTPGPWIAIRSGAGFISSIQVVTEDQQFPIAGVWVQLDRPDLDNGNIIAAAPEMLAIIKAFVAMIEDSMAGYEHPDIGVFVPGVTDVQITPNGSLKLSDARALIAKAEGSVHG